MGLHRNVGFLSAGAALIALYLLVKNPSGVGTLITQGPTGVSNVVKAFQGR
jgi:hypothetical protein